MRHSLAVADALRRHGDDDSDERHDSRTVFDSDVRDAPFAASEDRSIERTRSIVV
jgi:hypothetical protein